MAMAAPYPLLGDGITDDTLLSVARFLPSAKDLLCLQLACPRFAAKIIAAPRRCWYDVWAAAAQEMLSIPEEAARLWGGGVQRAGTRVGAGPRSRELAGSDTRSGIASGAAGVRSGARRGDAV